MKTCSDSNVLPQKALSLYKDFSNGSLEKSDPKPLTASKDVYTDSGIGLGWKYMKITGEASSADAKLLLHFWQSWQSCLRRNYTIQRKSSVEMKLSSSWRRCPLEPTFVCKNWHKKWKERWTLVLKWQCCKARSSVQSEGHVLSRTKPEIMVPPIYHKKMGEYSETFWERDRERPYSHNFISEYYCTCSMLLF